MDELIVPKCAFVSIMDETAYNHLSSVPSISIKYQSSPPSELKVQEAPEPTNVIWENRDFDKAIRYAKLILVVMAVLIVLFITFLATVKAKSMTNELIGKYDDSINCEEIHHMYPDNVLSQLSADEWVDYYKNGGEEQERQIASTLSCFCTAQYMEIGNDAAEMSW